MGISSYLDIHSYSISLPAHRWYSFFKELDMKIDREHSLLVRTLAKNPRQILAEITPGRMNLLHAAVGICGEAGELLDSVKKACIYNQTIDTVNLIEELGDLEFYMEQLRQECGITREETLAANMDKLSLRYKEMHFSNEAAQARRDKMIVNEAGRLDFMQEENGKPVSYGLDEGISS